MQFDPVLLDRVDAARGEVPRQVFVAQVLEAALAGPDRQSTAVLKRDLPGSPRASARPAPPEVPGVVRGSDLVNDRAAAFRRVTQ